MCVYVFSLGFYGHMATNHHHPPHTQPPTPNNNHNHQAGSNDVPTAHPNPTVKMPMLEVKLALIDRRVRFQPDLLTPNSLSSSSSSSLSILGFDAAKTTPAASLRELVQHVIGGWVGAGLWGVERGGICMHGLVCVRWYDVRSCVHKHKYTHTRAHTHIYIRHVHARANKIGGFFHIATLVKRLDLQQQDTAPTITATATTSASASAAGGGGGKGLEDRSIIVPAIAIGVPTNITHTYPPNPTKATPNHHAGAASGTYLRELQADPRLCFALTAIHEVLAETEEVRNGLFLDIFDCGMCVSLCVGG